MKKSDTVYQYLLFDLDDTLIEFEAVRDKAFMDTMAHYGLTVDEEEFKRYLGINARLWREHEQGRLDIDTLRVRRFEEFLSPRVLDYAGMDDRFQDNIAASARPLPGALALVQAASARYKIIVASNGVSRTQRGKLARSNMLPYISHIMISGEIGAQKPSEAFFLRVFEAVGCFDRDKYLIIGDQLSSDITGGQNAGIDTCWLNTFGREMTLKTPPTYTIAHLDGLYELLGLERC